MSDLLIDILAGFTGGIAAVYVGQPLDTIKVNMQLYQKKNRSMFSCMANIVRQKGLRGYYAGTYPALWSSCADNAIMFGSYGQCQNLVAKLAGVSDRRDLSHLQNAAAGSIASLFTSTVVAPTELLKIRLQCLNENSTKTKRNMRTIPNIIEHILKVDGWKGIFRGLGCTIARESIGCAFFFGLYEWTREKLRPAGESKEKCSPLATIVAGGAAGAAAWSAVLPIDVIKSRVQMSQEPIGFPLVKEQVRHVGLRGLYRGFLPTLVKTVPTTGLLLLTVEYAKPLYRQLIKNITDANKTPISNDGYDKKPTSFFSLCDFMAGWTSGIVSTVVGHPMDTVRVVQQVTNTNAIVASKKLYAQDKLLGYFRGMMFPVLTTGVVNSIFFGVNSTTMRYLHKFRSNGTDEDKDNEDIRFCCDAKKLKKYWHLDVFLSGCTAGVIYSFINIPVEVIKTMLQALTVSNPKTEKPQKFEPPKTTNSIKLAKELYKSNGIRSLYRGGWMILIRDVPSAGLYMITYEHSCCILKKLLHSDKKTESMPMYICAISGGFAGVVSWLIVMPFDVIKSKIIVDDPMNPLYKGAWDCAKKMFAEGGAKLFFRGFVLLCVRCFPVNGIMFLIYEVFLNACNRYTANNEFMTTTPVKSRWS